MAKRSWFGLIKRLFVAEGHSKSEKGKRRRWVFGLLKSKRLASVEAPSPSKERALSEEAEKKRRKEVLSSDIAATADAAEAPLRAAQVPADVGQLSGNSGWSNQESKEESQEASALNGQIKAPLSTHQNDKEIQGLAATRIQTAFRGYLARKALRALKGLVRLQAIIRGRAVRRQAITTLKCLQSIVNIQSQVSARRSQMLEGTGNFHDNTDLQDVKVKEIKVDSNSERRWDDSILSKEEAKALCLSKRDAMIKRERIKEYYFSHRRSAESERNKFSEKWRHWLEQWVDTQLAKEEENKNLDRTLSSNSGTEEFGGRKIKTRNSPKLLRIDGLEPSKLGPRRSFHHMKQSSAGDDSAFPISPVVPSYMAATESAKAKTRSLSSPRLRPGSLDSYSDTHSPYKHKLFISSINSEATTSSTICTSRTFQERSPGSKGLPGSAKLSRTFKDLSVDSECSLQRRDWNGGFRCS